MRKHQDSAADQIWKEKLESSATPWDAAFLVALVLVLLVFAV
jgi:hypothetical protein